MRKMSGREQVFKQVGEEILTNKNILRQEMEQIQSHDTRYLFEKDTQIGEDFFLKLGEGMIQHNPESEEIKASIRTWGENAAQFCLKHQVSLSGALRVLPHFREVLTKVIEKKCLDYGLSLHDSFIVYGTFENVLDHAAHAFSHTFLNKHIVDLEHAKKQMQEISVPVVPIKQGTAVLPLIGDMDDERSEFLQQRTLERTTELELSHIIIDLSGINTINTWFAQHLIQLIDALQLLGIEPSISGMRPELSQTIVHLGITFKHVPKYLTLEQALNQHPVYT
ncbi:STAS domain-containing protein [Alteribacillus iranensis]|nr:STAS domain-containing protein [Alteribacillus iranensis]